MEMLRLVKKLHMYAGLLCFSALMVYGIAGISATFSHGRPNAGRLPVRFVAFTAPAHLSDFEISNLVHRALELPLTGPIPQWAIKRDLGSRLTLNFYNVNGLNRVTVLEDEQRLMIESERVSVWRFLNHLHATTPNFATSHLPVRLWSWYNELALWSLLGLTASGLYLWLASRPGYSWAQIPFALGIGVFIVLYALTR